MATAKVTYAQNANYDKYSKQCGRQINIIESAKIKALVVICILLISHIDNGVRAFWKRRFLSLVFACLCFSKPLLIRILVTLSKQSFLEHN